MPINSKRNMRDVNSNVENQALRHTRNSIDHARIHLRDIDRTVIEPAEHSCLLSLDKNRQWNIWNTHNVCATLIDYTFLCLFCCFLGGLVPFMQKSEPFQETCYFKTWKITEKSGVQLRTDMEKN